jgi:hypothetical protein
VVVGEDEIKKNVILVKDIPVNILFKKGSTK